MHVAHCIKSLHFKNDTFPGNSIFELGVVASARLKGIAHPKMKIIPLIIHPHVVPNL